MRTILLTSLFAAASLIQVGAQNFYDEFNTPGTLANNYNVYLNATPPQGSPYTQVATGGIFDSGAVAVSLGSATITQDATLIRKDNVFDFSKAGSGVKLFSMLNVSTQTAGGNRLLQMGLVNENTSGMNGNAGLAFTSLRLSTVGTTGNTYTPQWQTKTATGNTVSPSLTPNVSLTVGNWYQLVGVFLNIGGGNIEASGFLQDFGTDGLTPGNRIFSFPTTILNSADIASDATVYAALRGFKADGLNMIDNFGAITVVPEPGSLGLLLAGLSVFMVRGMRKS